MNSRRFFVGAFASALPASLAASVCLAQGGPPMVTDDPETPGDGRWEINLAAFGGHTHSGRTEVNVPDADINYGLGDSIQLKVDVPWTFAREAGGGWKSGLGTGNVGVKWRFIDVGEEGTSISTYPQYLSGWAASSRNRDIASSDKEFFLPFEVATKAGKWSLDGEVGRTFVRGSDNQWVVGGIVAHDCASAGECMLEVHEVHDTRASQTLVNLGMHWKISDALNLLASAGREVGPKRDDQQSFAYYLGFQVLL